MPTNNSTIEEAAALALSAIRDLVTCDDPQEYARLDKIAQRATYLVHGLTRSPGFSGVGVPQEQEGA